MHNYNTHLYNGFNSSGSHHVASILGSFASSGQARNVEFQNMSMGLRYKQWMAKHGQVYTNSDSEELFQIFKTNAELVDKTNSENLPDKLAPNQWADQTNEEYKNTSWGHIPLDANKRAAGLPLINATQNLACLMADGDHTMTSPGGKLH